MVNYSFQQNGFDDADRSQSSLDNTEPSTTNHQQSSPDKKDSVEVDISGESENDSSQNERTQKSDLSEPNDTVVTINGQSTDNENVNVRL